MTQSKRNKLDAELDCRNFQQWNNYEPENEFKDNKRYIGYTFINLHKLK